MRRIPVIFQINFLLINFLKLFKRIYDGYGFYLTTGRVIPFGCIFKNHRNISIGKDFSMGKFCSIYAQDTESKIIIGDRVAFNNHTMINADNGGEIIIGDGSIFGPYTVLRSSNHVFSSTSKFFRDQGKIPGYIFIGKNVWLGAGVIITPNVKVGDNVVIGAGSVVTKNIPDNSLAVGVPAKVIRNI